MSAVEIRIASKHLPSRMEEVRRWLSERGCVYKLASTAISGERVVIAFRRRFDELRELRRDEGGQFAALWHAAMKARVESAVMGAAPISATATPP
jgi:hypothetical protein